MMDCLEYRRHALEDPSTRDPGFLRHRVACRACAGWSSRQASFDARLADALGVDVPDGLASRILMQTRWRPRRRRWPVAVAASVLVVVGAGLFAWHWSTNLHLGDAVIAHIYHEPELLLQSEIEVDDVRLARVLSQVGGRLDGDIGKVTHAGLCIIGGRLSAHLVVAGQHGPVAVLVMPGKGMTATMPVGDDSLQGTIVPVGHGSIAVVGVRGESTTAVSERISRMLFLES